MTTENNKQPTHRVYAVRKTGKNTKPIWQVLGAAWPNADGKGFNLKLNLMPVGEADIVIREIDPEADAKGEQQ